MKKYNKYIAIGLVLFGFACGIVWERTAQNMTEEEWMQVSQEACDMRIKTIKFACRK